MISRSRFAGTCLALMCLTALTSLTFGPALRAQDPPAPADPATVTVRVQTADGSVWVGTLAAGKTWVLSVDGAETRIPAADARQVMVSTMKQADGRALEKQVRELIGQLGVDDYEAREAATRALGSLSPAAAPYVAAAEKSGSPEVRMRAREALEKLLARGVPTDGRDLMVLEAGKTVIRGWLQLEALELETAVGPVRLTRDRIRMIMRADVAANAIEPLPPGNWLPPMAREVARLPLAVVVTIDGGSQLAGHVAAESLDLLDADGAPIVSNGLVSMKRTGNPADGRFTQTLKGGQTVDGRLAATDLLLKSTAGQRSLPVALIESLVVGQPKLSVVGNPMHDLIQQFRRAEANGAARPTQRFWVHINDQRSNPWDSASSNAMTWTLHKVVGSACLVGSDSKTDAYKGDTSIGEALPILAIRRAKLSEPPGLETDFYRGWTGAEVRLTKPVCGEDLHSLADANKIIKAEFGDEWEMAEFHMGNGGWGFWAAWEIEDK